MEYKSRFKRLAGLVKRFEKSGGWTEMGKVKEVEKVPSSKIKERKPKELEVEEDEGMETYADEDEGEDFYG